MLIALSGIDGCGKTVQVTMLEERLKAAGQRVVVTKAYDDIAKVACRPFMETWTDDPAIAFLFQALHAQQYACTRDALAAGNLVIADRWDESYLAYHRSFGFLSGADNDSPRDLLNQLAFRDLVPDLGFIIVVPPEVARRRRMSRGQVERFEDRPDEYYERIQDAYARIAEERNWYMLDGRKTPNDIHEELFACARSTLHL